MESKQLLNQKDARCLETCVTLSIGFHLVNLLHFPLCAHVITVWANDELYRP